MVKEGGHWALGKEAQGWPDSTSNPGQATPPLRASAPSCQTGTSGEPFANCMHLEALASCPLQAYLQPHSDNQDRWA